MELIRNLSATPNFTADNDDAAYLPEDSETARWMISAGRPDPGPAMIPVGGDRHLIDDRAAAGGLTAKPAA
jgi:hypothetical protein